MLLLVQILPISSIRFLVLQHHLIIHLNNAQNWKCYKEVLKTMIILLKELQNIKISKKNLVPYNVNGNDLNMWMIKPLILIQTKQYPLFMYQYSGPGSQSVQIAGMAPMIIGIKC